MARIKRSAAEVAESRHQAFRLWITGRTYRQLADHFEVSTGTIHNWIHREIRAPELDPKRDDIRSLHLARLTDVLRIAYRAMLSGDVAAARVVMDASTKIAKVYGVDDATRTLEADAADRLAKSHQQLANDLGSIAEVIKRALAAAEVGEDQRRKVMHEVQSGLRAISS